MGTRERRSRSNESDLLISELFAVSGADSDEVAVAAVGSFGRGELTPGSDLDIVTNSSHEIFINFDITFSTKVSRSPRYF